MTQLLQLALDGLFDGALIALGAIGISIVFAVQKFANVAQAGLMSVGAFGTYAVGALGLGIIISGLIGMATAVVVAVLCYFAAFRPLRRSHRVTLLIASIGVDLVLRNLLGFRYGGEIRGYGTGVTPAIRLGDVHLDPLGLTLFVVALVTMAVVWFILTGTSIGRDMRAVADLPDLARLIGVSELKVHLVSWILVGATAGIAGTAIALKSSLTPDLGWHALLAAFAAAILGGLGDVKGAVAGGLLMGVGMAYSTIWLSPTYRPALAFAVMTVALLIRPNGLFGRMARI